VFDFFLGGGRVMGTKQGLPTKHLFRIMSKQYGNFGCVIELHNMEDRGDGGYPGEFSVSFVILRVIVFPVLPAWCLGGPAN